MKEPHYGAHAYNPKLQPKLFSQVEEPEDLDTTLERLADMDAGGKGELE